MKKSKDGRVDHTRREHGGRTEPPRAREKGLAATALDNLSTQDRKEDVQRFGVPGPAQEAADWIRRIIVTSFVIVLAGSFLALVLVVTGTVGYFFGETGTDDAMLTVFTTTGFLAGLLDPQSSQRGG